MLNVLTELAILSLQFISFTIDKKYHNQKQDLFIGAPTYVYIKKKFILKERKKIIFIKGLIPLVYGTETLAIHLQ